MQNLKTSTLIRNGLKHLWDGQDYDEVNYDSKEEFLCHAIVRAGRCGTSDWMIFTRRNLPEVETRLNEIKAMIESRLFPYNNLAAWLQHCGGARLDDMTQFNLQKHRRRWALKMIAEFKRKGD